MVGGMFRKFDDGALFWRKFQSTAFPTSKPFWRGLCMTCDWMTVGQAGPPSIRQFEADRCPVCAAPQIAG